MKLTFSSPFLSLLLIPLLVVSPLAAQAPISGNSAAVTSTDLQIRVIESAEPTAKVTSTSAKGLTVAVTTTSGAAVPDAAVALRLPDSGATGTFADGSHAAVTYTDASGRARFAVVHWGETHGSVSMRVTATKGNSHAALLLNQSLTSASATVVEVPQPVSQNTPAVRQPGQTAARSPVAMTTPPAVTVSPSPNTVQIAPASAAPPSQAIAKPEPSVSVTGASPDASQHSSKTKWVILAAVIAGAAGGSMAFIGKGKSTSAAAAAPGLTIGNPSVSVGAPVH